MWKDEKLESTTTNYVGDLYEAIKIAEEEFEEVNGNNIPTICEVQISLEDKLYEIPKEYWVKFRKQ